MKPFLVFVFALKFHNGAIGPVGQASAARNNKENKKRR
jgi:hypothetical protein